MKCPLDGSELFIENYEGDIMVNRCDVCHGTWLGKEELEAIQETREIDYTDELAIMTDLGYNAYQLASQKTGRTIHCPTCGTEMEAREYARCSQVMIDVCPYCHGIWLDRGELAALEVFFETTKTEASLIRKNFFANLLGNFGLNHKFTKKKPID